MGVKIKDLTGQQFGFLTVVEFYERKNNRTFWLCRCDCGNNAIVKAQNLASGDTKSCGCWARKHCQKPKGEASFNKLYLRYRRQAKEREITWDLTRAEARHLFTSDCHYCRAKPAQVCYRKGSNGAFTYNGIDRVDNNKGYTVENCCSCCGQCNRSKTDMAVDEFREWVCRVATRFGSIVTFENCKEGRRNELR